MNIYIDSGAFFGGDIEPGTFHCIDFKDIKEVNASEDDDAISEDSTVLIFNPNEEGK